MEPAFYQSKPKPRGPADDSPSLFDTVYDDTDSGNTTAPKADDNRLDRVQSVHAALSDSARHWIDLGKPVAVAVANAHGKVTAETFANEARKRGKLRPETEQRSLSYIAVMLKELAREGHLELRVHANGKADKDMAENGNEQCVYLPKSKAVAA